MNSFLKVTLSLTILYSLTTGCVIVPCPHTRIHKYAVSGHVLSKISNKPIKGLTIVDENSEICVAMTDSTGRFSLDEETHWHFAKLYGALNLSLLPSFDVSRKTRTIVIKSNDENLGTFVVLPDADNIILIDEREFK